MKEKLKCMDTKELKQWMHYKDYVKDHIEALNKKMRCLQKDIDILKIESLKIEKKIKEFTRW